MELKIINKGGKDFTQFKIPIKQLNLYKELIKNYVDISNPTKKSTRFIYFECEGNVISAASRR